MAEHPVAKHLSKLAELHAHTRHRQHEEATQLAAARDLVDRQRADLLAGTVSPSDEAGSDHGSS